MKLRSENVTNKYIVSAAVNNRLHDPWYFILISFFRSAYSNYFEFTFSNAARINLYFLIWLFFSTEWIISKLKDSVFDLIEIKFLDWCRFFWCENGIPPRIFILSTCPSYFPVHKTWTEFIYKSISAVMVLLKNMY